MVGEGWLVRNEENQVMNIDDMATLIKLSAMSTDLLSKNDRKWKWRRENY